MGSKCNIICRHHVALVGQILLLHVEPQHKAQGQEVRHMRLGPILCLNESESSESSIDSNLLWRNQSVEDSTRIHRYYKWALKMHQDLGWRSSRELDKRSSLREFIDSSSIGAK